MTFQSFLPFTPETENNFTLTLTELISSAFELVQIGVDGEDIEPEYYERAVNIVNLVIQEMQTQGLHLTSYKVGWLFLQPDQFKYVIEDENSTNEYWQRTLSADEATGQTVLSVDSVEDLEVDDPIGIILDDGSLQWTAVTAVGADTVTVDDALTDDATEGNYLFNYRTALRQISRVHQFWRRDNYVNDVPIQMISQQEYDLLPRKDAPPSGLPSQAYYHRTIPKGVLRLWVAPQNAQYIIGFWYECKIGQMRNSSDAIDFDQFYLPAITHTIALRMCNRFGISTEIMTRVKAEQEELMALALTYDDEQTPIKISPNRRV